MLKKTLSFFMIFAFSVTSFAHEYYFAYAELTYNELQKRFEGTIIFSTHRMEQVEEICDHIVLVNKGGKILDGTVGKIKQDFKENIFELGFDQALLAEHTAIHLFDVKESHENKLRIRINDGFSNNDVIQFFINKGLNIRSFNEVLPSLNDIFIRLIQGTPEARQFQN